MKSRAQSSCNTIALSVHYTIPNKVTSNTEQRYTLLSMPRITILLRHTKLKRTVQYHFPTKVSHATSPSALSAKLPREKIHKTRTIAFHKALTKGQQPSHSRSPSAISFISLSICPGPIKFHSPLAHSIAARTSLSLSLLRSRKKLNPLWA